MIPRMRIHFYTYIACLASCMCVDNLLLIAGSSQKCRSCHSKLLILKCVDELRRLSLALKSIRQPSSDSTNKLAVTTKCLPPNCLQKRQRMEVGIDLAFSSNYSIHFHSTLSEIQCSVPRLFILRLACSMRQPGFPHRWLGIGSYYCTIVRAHGC